MNNNDIDDSNGDKRNTDFKVLNTCHLVIEMLYIIRLEPTCWPSV
jgi:hypothetical protein